MSNNEAESDKAFPRHGENYHATDRTVKKEIQNLRPLAVTTLPSMVTICLAPCSLCTGDYVDVTHSFRLRCCCPCHNNGADKADEISE